MNHRGNTCYGTYIHTLAGLPPHVVLSDVLTPSLVSPCLSAGAAIRQNLVESMKNLLDAAESMGIPLVREGGDGGAPGVHIYMLRRAFTKIKSLDDGQAEVGVACHP